MSQERSRGPDDSKKEAEAALKSKQDVREKSPLTKADIIRSAQETGLRLEDIKRQFEALKMLQEESSHTPRVCDA